MEIGHFIEEPFNKEYQIIPLSQLVTVVRADVSGKDFKYNLAAKVWSKDE